MFLPVGLRDLPEEGAGQLQVSCINSSLEFSNIVSS